MFSLSDHWQHVNRHHTHQDTLVPTIKSWCDKHRVHINEVNECNLGFLPKISIKWNILRLTQPSICNYNLLKIARWLNPSCHSVWLLQYFAQWLFQSWTQVMCRLLSSVNRVLKVASWVFVSEVVQDCLIVFSCFGLILCYRKFV